MSNTSDEMTNSSSAAAETEAYTATADPHAAVADAVIQKYVVMGAAVNFIPLPLVGTVAVAGVQLAMLKELSKVYGVDFRADLGKSVIAALVGTLASSAGTGGALGVVHGLLGSVPVLGFAVKVAAIPTVSGGITYAIGKTFRNHFATGGDLLNFDAAKAKNYMKTKYRSVRGGFRTAGTGAETAR